MGSKPALNKTIMKQLVQEIEIVRMSEAEALDYIEIKLGRRISVDTLYSYKRQVRSEPERNAWLSFYARSGFVDHYRDRLAEMELIQSDLMRMWIEETARKDKAMKDKLLLQQLAKNIRENCTVLSELGLGMPILASMKATIDKASAPTTAIELTDGEGKD